MKNRRRFLLDVVSTAAAGAVMCASGCGGQATPGATATPEGGTVRLSLSEQPELATKGSSLGIEVAGLEDQILVIHRPDGTWLAVNRSCTHLGCDVGYVADSDEIVCPCHKSVFSAAPSNAGARLEGPARKPLASYAVREEGGELLIDVG